MYSHMRRAGTCLCMLLSAVSAHIHAAPLRLSEAEALAVNYSPMIKGWSHQANQQRQQGIAAAQLPDPSFSLALANFPVDSFELDQEPMSQLKLSFEQMIPPGDTLKLNRRRYKHEYSQRKHLLENETYLTLRAVRIIWLEILYAEAMQKVILNDQKLFVQLLGTTRSLYAVGRQNQQDVILAQLQLSKLQQGLIKVTQQISSQRASLGQWIGIKASQQAFHSTLPAWQHKQINAEQISCRLKAHPHVKSLDHKTAAMNTGIALARQHYKPSWGIGASYSYREALWPDRTRRSDLLSAQVSISAPLFPKNRQDRQLAVAQLKKAASSEERVSMLNKMSAQATTEQANMVSLQQQQALFENTILHQSKQRAESSLSAYQSNSGDFNGVMRAYISDLNTQIDYERIKIDQLKSLAKLKYFFPSSPSSHTEESTCE
ncbi:MAG: TolC family protein [Gammaproteobacteria bacterium]|nr:TolC family protein [Gammaproteobacteria bacterium]